LYCLSYVFLTDWRDPLFSWFSDKFYIDFEYGQKCRVRIFVDVFRVLCFSPDTFLYFLCRFVCLMGVGGWGSGASFWMFICFVRLADCGSRLGTFMRCMVVYVGCGGLSDLFVLLPPSPVFLELLLCFVADWFVEY
jgi:hypothetical protein